VSENTTNKPVRYVSKGTSCLKVEVKNMNSKDVTFINRCLKRGDFEDVSEVVSECVKKVRKEMAEREIRQMRVAAAKEASKVMALTSSLRASSDQAFQVNGQSNTVAVANPTGADKKTPSPRKKKAAKAAKAAKASRQKSKVGKPVKFKMNLVTSIAVLSTVTLLGLIIYILTRQT